MDEKLYRDTLFSRAMEVFTARGGYGAAYLFSQTGLLWAKTVASADVPNISALVGAAADFFARAEAAASDTVEKLVLVLPGDRTVSFYRFQHAGEAVVTFFLVLLSESGSGDEALIPRVVAEIKEDQEAFY